MFLITVYRDAEVIAVDKIELEFAQNLNTLVAIKYDKNIVVAAPYNVEYLSSSATKILIHGMSWIFSTTKERDCLISLTGTDYPLVLMGMMEAILEARNHPEFRI